MTAQISYADAMHFVESSNRESHFLEMVAGGTNNIFLAEEMICATAGDLLRRVAKGLHDTIEVTDTIATVVKVWIDV